MTLFDLGVLLKRNWLLVVTIPVACALVTFGVTAVWPPTYVSEESVLAAAGLTPPQTEYVIIAFLAGLLAAVAIVILKDMARGTIHNAEEVEENYDLRLLGRMSLPSARRRSDTAVQTGLLLAALEFAGKGSTTQSICLIPLEDAETAQTIAAELEAAAEATGHSLTLTVAPPVAASADFAYLAPESGGTVLIVEAMRTRRAPLEAALRQLSLSATPIAGFILVNAA